MPNMYGVKVLERVLMPESSRSFQRGEYVEPEYIPGVFRATSVLTVLADSVTEARERVVELRQGEEGLILVSYGPFDAELTEGVVSHEVIA